MDYCKSKGIPSAQPWAWTEAETAWRTTMRKAQINLFESHALAEEMAREFYKLLGYTITAKQNPNYMRDSQHPTEVACYQMAQYAIERLGNTP